ncbi:QacE family quaternary ammonium compound efflux SMR transporter [Lysinibacillus sp. 2017]|uniref:DMT family transporter n=1 Tax=unclassified Lysinibacillus TaxID=2636778 RepID=UPI000D529098|nr:MULTISPECIES: multidrug efflux SMR transporter [unclassified Lysinibacillus]AWE07565.1 QacE family quaternary ammonium compound efflux SMR transporter [Lysinibacillus sp. 2017]TGN36728.1 multidrug efflux SMR transporter [Lysinibacillus sp. S2017]
MTKYWILVLLAGLIEIIWAMGLKYATSIWMWAGVVALIVLSFYILIIATEKLPVSTVYAVFTGIGTAGTVIVETVLFNEPFSLSKIGFIALLLLGVIGLKLLTNEPKETRDA